MKEEAKKTGGKGTNVLSGRALFTYDPTMFQDDEDAMDEIVYEEDNEGGEESKQEESKADYENNGKLVDGHANGTVNGNAAVDADLFQAEAVDGNEEEPDFD